VDGGVIHIQFPPPSVTLSVFVTGEMDHLQTHSLSLSHTHTQILKVSQLLKLLFMPLELLINPLTLSLVPLVRPLRNFKVGKSFLSV